MSVAFFNFHEKRNQVSAQVELNSKYDKPELAPTLVARINFALSLVNAFRPVFGFSFMGFPHPRPPQAGQYLNRKKRSPAGLLSGNKLCKLCNIFLGNDSAGGLPCIPRGIPAPHRGALCCLRFWEVNRYFAQGRDISLCEAMIKEECHFNQGKAKPWFVSRVSTQRKILVTSVKARSAAA